MREKGLTLTGGIAGRGERKSVYETTRKGNDMCPEKGDRWWYWFREGTASKKPQKGVKVNGSNGRE